MYGQNPPPNILPGQVGMAPYPYPLQYTVDPSGRPYYGVPTHPAYVMQQPVPLAQLPQRLV